MSDPGRFSSSPPMALKRARYGAGPDKSFFAKRLSRLFRPLRSGVDKLYTKLYVRLQTAGFCPIQAPRSGGHNGADRTAERFSGFAMTVHSTLRKKPARRGATAPAKRRLHKVAAKRGARGPAIAELIATRLEEDIVLGRRHPRERLIEQDLCQ